MDWVDPLVRGLGALAFTAVVFGAAHLRFRTKGGGDGASSDLGLD